MSESKEEETECEFCFHEGVHVEAVCLSQGTYIHLLYKCSHRSIILLLLHS